MTVASLSSILATPYELSLIYTNKIMVASQASQVPILRHTSPKSLHPHGRFLFLAKKESKYLVHRVLGKVLYFFFRFFFWRLFGLLRFEKVEHVSACRRSTRCVSRDHHCRRQESIRRRATQSSPSQKTQEQGTKVKQGGHAWMTHRIVG
jgi:hypothetical protein